MSDLKETNRVTFYLSHMADRGFTPEQVLEGTGLSVEAVGDVLFRPEAEQYRRMIHNMLELSQDPYLGIHLGSEFKVSNLGVLGYAALSSNNLAQSRQLWTRYGVLNETLLFTNNRVKDGKWYSEVTEKFPLGDILPFAIEEFISQTVKMATSLTSRPFPITKLCLTYQAPDDITVYEREFACPIHFNQPHNVIYFDASCLDNPISLANEEVFKICDQQCAMLVSQLQSNCPLSTEIRNALVRKPGEFPSLEEMADMLKMGSRTLRRRLAKEDISYQQILADTRRDLAIQYLQNTSLTPKEIGFLLGYNSVSNFRRAFKGWTGKKLSDYT